MHIQRQEHKNKGAFFIEKDGEWVAEMTYYREGRRKLVIDDIEVDESLGRGIVETMVEEVARYAEKNNLLIKPLCPRVKKVLESSEDYEDVLTR
jgi:predicted GNAT family acetyltransferase